MKYAGREKEYMHEYYLANKKREYNSKYNRTLAERRHDKEK